MKTFGKHIVISSFIILLLSFSTVLAKINKDKDCLKCHPTFYKKLVKKNIHEPFKEKKCNSCHKFHGFQNKIAFKDEIIILCNNCHNVLENTDEENYHAPIVDDLSCVNCHSPHSSDLQKLLKEPVSTLCADCHDTEDEDFKKLHVVDFEIKLCVSCHNPHGSNNETFLYADQHPPFEERECATCHEDRTIEELKSPELCLECHDQPEPTGVHSKKRISDKSCISCHSPHILKK